MLNDYSATESMIRSTGVYKKVAFIQKEDAALNIHKKETVGVALAQQGEKTKYKSVVTCHKYQKKGHFSYEFKSPAPNLRYEVAVHLNLEAESQEDIPYFHFLNLVEDNPDASIEAIMFGDDYYPVEINYEDSLADSLEKEINHVLLFVHNHNLFRKGYINPNWIPIDTGYSIEFFCNPIFLKNIHRL